MSYIICIITVLAACYAVLIVAEEHYRMNNPHSRINEIEHPTHKLTENERERINEIYYKELAKLKAQKATKDDTPTETK